MPLLHYRYTHTATEATTGYFTCEPDPSLTLQDALALLEATPLDDFLHRVALRQLCALPAAQIRDFAAQTADASAPCATPQSQTTCGVSPAQLTPQDVATALVQECALLVPQVADLFDTGTAQRVRYATPLPYLTHALQPDAALHRQWSEVFASNITGHHILPHPQEEELPPLYTDAELATLRPDSALPRIGELRAALLKETAPAWDRPPAQVTAQRALEILVDNGIIAGMEMRHEASLSPIALLRPWRLDISVENRGLYYTVQGEGTTYGRGLSLAAARASYAMEMVERASAYASVDAQGIVGTSRPMPLFYGTRTALTAQGHRVLDPNLLPLDAPYADAPLHWLEAAEAQTGACVLVPAQAVYLFCNLDEISLSLAPGSTGLATGNTLAEAKQAALTEIVERDAEGTIPYDRRRCFVVQSEDARLQSLLDDYAARGIHVQCMDITSEFGVPCYQCFVMGQRGEVHRATGAHLNGSRALLSALTEVPYPYPNGPASGAPLRGLPVRTLESLPDYSMESPTRNVQLLEQVFAAHGRLPLYVELTRTDLTFPVVRALVPGLTLNAEPDATTRIAPRLYANYLTMFK